MKDEIVAPVLRELTVNVRRREPVTMRLSPQASPSPHCKRSIFDLHPTKLNKTHQPNQKSKKKYLEKETQRSTEKGKKKKTLLQTDDCFIPKDV